MLASFLLLASTFKKVFFLIRCCQLTGRSGNGKRIESTVRKASSNRQRDKAVESKAGISKEKVNKTRSKQWRLLF